MSKGYLENLQQLSRLHQQIALGKHSGLSEYMRTQPMTYLTAQVVLLLPLSVEMLQMYLMPNHGMKI